MRKALWLLVFLSLLVACGAPATATNPTQSLPDALPTSAPVVTAPPAEVPSPPADTAVPTAVAPTAPASAALATPVQKGYAALVLIDALSVMTADTAKLTQDGKIDGANQLGRMIAIGAFYKAITEAIGKDAPDPALAAAWEQARVVLPKLSDVLAQWNQQKVTADQVPGLLAPVNEEIDQMLTTAEGDLEQAYNADPTQLKEMRDKAMASLVNALSATPTPKS